MEAKPVILNKEKYFGQWILLKLTGMTAKYTA